MLALPEARHGESIARIAHQVIAADTFYGHYPALRQFIQCGIQCGITCGECFLISRLKV